MLLLLLLVMLEGPCALLQHNSECGVLGSVTVVSQYSPQLYCIYMFRLSRYATNNTVLLNGNTTFDSGSC